MRINIICFNKTISHKKQHKKTKQKLYFDKTNKKQPFNKVVFY